MTTTLYERLACPIDKTHPLKLSVFHGTFENVIEGILECPACSRYFPIIGAIPVLAPDEYRDASVEALFLEKWIEKLDSRYGKGTGFTLPPADDAA